MCQTPFYGFDSGAFGHVGVYGREPHQCTGNPTRGGRITVGAELTAWTVPSLPLHSDVLSTLYVPSTIDYLSLDVEGAEDLVMSTFPWHAHNITLMSSERPSRALQDLLRSHGYHNLRNSQYQSANDDTFWLHPTITESIVTTRLGQHGTACACPMGYESAGDAATEQA